MCVTGYSSDNRALETHYGEPHSGVTFRKADEAHHLGAVFIYRTKPHSIYIAGNDGWFSRCRGANMQKKIRMGLQFRDIPGKIRRSCSTR